MRARSPSDRAFSHCVGNLVDSVLAFTSPVRPYLAEPCRAEPRHAEPCFALPCHRPRLCLPAETRPITENLHRDYPILQLFANGFPQSMKRPGRAFCLQRSQRLDRRKRKQTSLRPRPARAGPQQVSEPLAQRRTVSIRRVRKKGKRRGRDVSPPARGRSHRAKRDPCGDQRLSAGPPLGKRTVNTDPLGSLVTVTSPPIMRASLTTSRACRHCP